MTATPAIAVENLTVTFSSGLRRIAAVQEVSFEVARGETFGIVGESGSGKSTVLKAVAGLAPASNGGVRIEGRPMSARRSKSERRLLQYVFQDPYGSLHPRQSIDRILREPLEIHGLPDRETTILSALADVGLDPRHRFRYPHQLSGGQRQRVAIARALILKPALVILDEPTSSLDRSVQRDILALLRALQDAHGLTYLFITHDLAVVRAMADEILVMRDGKVVERGLTEAIFERPKDEYTRSLIRAADLHGPGA